MRSSFSSRWPRRARRTAALTPVLVASVLVAAGCTAPAGPGPSPPDAGSPLPARPGTPAPPPAATSPPTAPAQDPRLAALAADPLVCNASHECATFWTRAQAWVSRHSAMAIVTASDAVIETLPPNAPGKLGFRVVREPIGAGRARIAIATACHGGCSVEVRTAATQAFRRYLRTGS